jgi:hypothetical protein
MNASRVSRAGLIALTVLVSGNAFATHKNWFLADAGSSCHLLYSGAPGAVRYIDGAIVNTTSTAIGVTCPYTLAGRFASQPGPPDFPSYANFPMATWAAADSDRPSTIRGYDGSATDDFSCTTWALTSTGSTYSGAARTRVATNNNVQIDMNIAGTWGGLLGTGASITLRALGHSCLLPGNSSIYGYELRLCQRDSNCHSG